MRTSSFFQHKLHGNPRPTVLKPVSAVTRKIVSLPILSLGERGDPNAKAIQSMHPTKGR